MSLLNQKSYTYKYSKACSVCKFCRRHPDVKKVLVNLRMFNPNGMSVEDAISHYKFPLGPPAVRNHCNKHIFEVETRVVNNSVRPDQKIEVLGQKIIGNARTAHEDTLDEFISQFDDAVRAKELKMTVKDGLSAIKIKADIESKKRDDKKDILKIMAGSSGRPPERTQA